MPIPIIAGLRAGSILAFVGMSAFAQSVPSPMPPFLLSTPLSADCIWEFRNTGQTSIVVVFKQLPSRINYLHPSDGFIATAPICGTQSDAVGARSLTRAEVTYQSPVEKAGGGYEISGPPFDSKRVPRPPNLSETEKLSVERYKSLSQEGANIEHGFISAANGLTIDLMRDDQGNVFWRLSNGILRLDGMSNGGEQIILDPVDWSGTQVLPSPMLIATLPRQVSNNRNNIVFWEWRPLPNADFDAIRRYRLRVIG